MDRFPEVTKKNSFSNFFCHAAASSPIDTFLKCMRNYSVFKMLYYLFCTKINKLYNLYFEEIEWLNCFFILVEFF